MAITTHKSEAQMLRDYNMRSGTSDSKAATLRLMSSYTCGQMKRLPPTAVEKSTNSTKYSYISWFNSLTNDLMALKQEVHALQSV